MTTTLVSTYSCEQNILEKDIRKNVSQKKENDGQTYINLITMIKLITLLQHIRAFLMQLQTTCEITYYSK